MSLKPPYTQEELAALKRQLETRISATESEHPEARPLPPMEEEEAKDLLLSLADTATTRQLTTHEAFLAGQLLGAYRMAVEARMLGRRGRYYVVSADEIDRLQP